MMGVWRAGLKAILEVVLRGAATAGAVNHYGSPSIQVLQVRVIYQVLFVPVSH